MCQMHVILELEYQRISIGHRRGTVKPWGRMWWIRNAVFILFTSVACNRQQFDNMLLDINVTFPSSHTRRVSHSFSMHIKACTCSGCPSVLDCSGIGRVAIAGDSASV
jgi:hypothetical protein